MITEDAALIRRAAALRRDVFVLGQGVAPEIEADGRDDEAVHAVVERDGAVVGTGRLLEVDGEARLGRIAVDGSRRGEGLGAEVVRELEAAAAALGLPRLRLHAQQPVVGFYERLGWTVVGAPDVEAGIAHRWMVRDLLPGLRPVADSDAEPLQALVGGCFAEYEGAVLEVDGLDAWMLRPATDLAEKGAALWVLPAGPDLAACCGWRVSGPGVVELKSLYVGAPWRRRGYAAALVGLVERAARDRDARTVELWTDSRFHDAHRLYARLGYVRTAGTRDLHDRSRTTEHHVVKTLGVHRRG
ncbi:MAG: GNAT family N-acetyltransferase [Mycobacteriales bacterium]